RHDDLKEMLDSNKDSLKLEAMKRIVAMIARGKNASDLFPAVVKNVACKNIEVRVSCSAPRSAAGETCLELSPVSRSPLPPQDPNQLIRASALRVLSSIRVPIIVPIMMLAIKEAASDMSPYVRKTAAHAIPKLYSLDSDQKDQLIEVIEKLLSDKTTLVAGSVVMAFEEVCPERIDLIHKNYRKLCNLLIDVEEWGQVVIINMLTRYARTQFLSPNQNVSAAGRRFPRAREGRESGHWSVGGLRPTQAVHRHGRALPLLEPRHAVSPKPCSPELQSRGGPVVMAVAQLYFHLAPKAEVGVIAKALVRLLRSHSEVQYVVLQNVATMSIKRRGMFEPYLKSFYIRSTDPTQIKILKLEVLTNLANETNISTILREFQTYIRSMDKDFVAATIQAIGRCATNIGKVRDTCLNGLVQLLSNRDELVVAESVVVIKKLLQMQPSQHSEIIKHMAKLTDNIQVPMARASILWLIGEYCEHVPKMAPDVLRKMAKSFTGEEDIVKLQVINLAAKLYLTNSKQQWLVFLCVPPSLLARAVRAGSLSRPQRSWRLSRQLIVPTEKSGVLNKYAKKLFLAQKPAPILESSFKDRDHFQLAFLNTKAVGYQELPDWPDEARAVPGSAVPGLAVRRGWSRWAGWERRAQAGRAAGWAGGGEGGPGWPASRSPPREQGECSSNPWSPARALIQSYQSINPSEEEEEEQGKKGKRKKKPQHEGKGNSGSSWEEGSVSESSSSESDSGSEAEESQSEPESKRRPTPPSSKAAPKATRKGTKEISLLDLDDFTTAPPQPASSPSVLSLSMGAAPHFSPPVPTAFLPPRQLLSPTFSARMAGEGLSVEYCFSRQPFVPDPHMVAVHIQFSNSAEAEVKGLRVCAPRLLPGIRLQEFPEIGNAPCRRLGPPATSAQAGPGPQSVALPPSTHSRQFYVSIQPPVGELLAPVFMSENEFKKEQGKLTGMSEITEKLTLPDQCQSDQAIVQRVMVAANVSRVPCGADHVYRW
uniref:AP-3 complex subunit beta n=1 Tax=Pelodiscus sinensis TaxID=13735 RepID=K7GBM7_PELSI